MRGRRGGGGMQGPSGETGRCVCPPPPSRGRGQRSGRAPGPPALGGRVWGRAAALSGGGDAGRGGGGTFALPSAQKQALAQGGGGGAGSGQWGSGGGGSPLTSPSLPGTSEIRGHGGSSGAN